MADPGYGANGERTDAAGLVTWAIQAPPIPYLPGQDYYLVYALGVRSVPWVDQNDHEAWKDAQPGDPGVTWSVLTG